MLSGYAGTVRGFLRTGHGCDPASVRGGPVSIPPSKQNALTVRPRVRGRFTHPVHGEDINIRPMPG